MTQYDEGVEQLFTFVQVFTASMNAFAHGANDIANAIAPVAGILAIYQTGELSSKTPVPKVFQFFFINHISSVGCNLLTARPYLLLQVDPGVWRCWLGAWPCTLRLQGKRFACIIGDGI